MTLTRRSRTFCLIAFALLFAGASFAATTGSGAAHWLSEAKKALEKKDLRKADLWLARCLASGAQGPELAGLMTKRDLPPAAFISGAYDRSFVDWFESVVRPRWGRGDADKRARYGSVEIESVTGGDYFATVVAAPELQSWLVSESEGVSRPLVLALGSAKPAPLVYAGKQVGGRTLIQFPAVRLTTANKPLHKVWPPEIADLDGDGVPEIWVRYNLIWGNGYTQVLSLYKIKDDSSLSLMKEFRGENEGIARRLSDGRVEVAAGFGSKPGLSHFLYDKHRLETWAYQKGKRIFVKVASKEIPHLLRSKDWEKFV